MGIETLSKCPVSAQLAKGFHTQGDRAYSHASLKLGRLRQEDLKFRASWCNMVKPKEKQKGGWACSSGAGCLPESGEL